MQYVFGSLFLGSSRFKLCRKATKTIRHQEIFADNIAGRPSIFSPGRVNQRVQHYEISLE